MSVLVNLALEPVSCSELILETTSLVEKKQLMFIWDDFGSISSKVYWGMLSGFFTRGHVFSTKVTLQDMNPAGDPVSIFTVTWN